MQRTLAAGVLRSATQCSAYNVLPCKGHTFDRHVALDLFRRQYHPTAACERGVPKKKSKKQQIITNNKRDNVLEKYGFESPPDDSLTDRYKKSRIRDGPQRTVRMTFDDMKWPQDADLDEKFAAKTLKSRLGRFQMSQDVRRRCGNFGIGDGEFVEWASKFAQSVVDGNNERLVPKDLVPLLIRSRLEGLDNLILSQFFAFLERDAPHVVKDMKYLREITDLRFPHEWTLGARTMKRRIIMHVGPTNSGKTYHALERLKNCKSGVYCSPLRLLAHEVYMRMMAAGVSCGLLTGEDRRYPDYTLQDVKPVGYTSTGTPITQVTSCTIEMLPVKLFDVAVIDEIQMISDKQRGWAWTSALLSLRARELHLCGEPSAVPLVKRICEMMDEEVEVREYSRLGELEVSSRSLEGSWKNIRAGDCVVVFSRAEIYGIKNTIEKKTGMRCAVIYGSLPPESRVKQAALFNDPNSDYDVLVASDAVGMGINLSINRVVFTTLEKFDGESVRPISVSQTRQIGGRAGRFNSGVSVGTVTTMQPSDIRALQSSMGTMPPSLDAAGIKPTTSMIEMFSHQFPDVSFSQLWSMFRDIASVDDQYFMCSFDDQESVAREIEKLPLTVSERYQLIYAPVNARDPIVKQCLQTYAAAIAYKRECNIMDVVSLPLGIPTNRETIQIFEQWHRGITLYTWLSYHFPSTFTAVDESFAIKEECENTIQMGLLSLRKPNRENTSGNTDEYLKHDDNKSVRKALGIY
ncbi:RNA helicase [Coemansia erecta]|nr:RNA helicase [Coemansia erecta]